MSGKWDLNPRTSRSQAERSTKLSYSLLVYSRVLSFALSTVDYTRLLLVVNPNYFLASSTAC
jgi:hypothetical protein